MVRVDSPLFRIPYFHLHAGHRWLHPALPPARPLLLMAAITRGAPLCCAAPPHHHTATITTHPRRSACGCTCGSRADPLPPPSPSPSPPPSTTGAPQPHEPYRRGRDPRADEVLRARRQVHPGDAQGARPGRLRSGEPRGRARLRLARVPAHGRLRRARTRQDEPLLAVGGRLWEVRALPWEMGGEGALVRCGDRRDPRGARLLGGAFLPT